MKKERTVKNHLMWGLLAFLFAWNPPAEAAARTSGGYAGLPENDSLSGFIRHEMKKWKIPGLALAVISNGKVIRESYYGYANLDHRVPVSATTVFPIASLDKQLTATCIMMLARQKRLALTDPINQYLDSLPTAWKPIQIRHLLSHTSGLPDEALESYQGKYFLVSKTQDIFRNIRRQNPMHAPGEHFLYSDAGFFLLNMILERVSGMAYETYLSKHVFEPLGMTRTAIINPFRVYPGKVTSYYRNYSGMGDSIQINIARACDNGPLYNDMGTTLEDFVRYALAIETHRLVDRESYEQMWTPFRAIGGREVSELSDSHTLFDGHASYGYGWELQRFGTRRIVYHAGFTGVSLMKIPEDGLTIVLFTNLTDPFGFRVNRLARQIAAYYVPDSAPFAWAPSPDPDIKTTNFISRVIEQLNAGTSDESFLADEFIPVLKAALPDYQVKIKRLGEMQEWEYITEEKETHNLRTRYYLARFEQKDLYYRVAINAEGKIAKLTIY